MPRIDQYAEAVEPVAPDTPAPRLLGRFDANPELLVIPVLQGNRVLGLLERSALLMRLTVSPASPLTAAQLMDPEPIVVDGAISARALSQILLQGDASTLNRGFIVTVAGRYVGVGTCSTLLRALCEKDSPPINLEAPAARPEPDQGHIMTLVDAELSGPINGILAVSELLQRLPVPDEALDHVRSIHEQAQSLLGVVQDARELAGISKPARPETTVLRTFVDGLEASWAARTAHDGVTLMVGYEGDTELAAEIDAERLRRVFDNLIGNALKFAREGMVEARLKAQVVGSMIHISARVRDDGPRVGAQNLSRLFETPDSIDDGFSLSVCRRLVEALDGRIWTEINAGRGTTINFELHAPRSQLLLEPISQSLALSVPILETKPHILIVDDNATNRVVAQALCEMFGCSCEAAEDGLEALEAVQARHFDLILMDIKMPRMDGVQATLAIRALEPPVSLMPIIALTANADPVDAASYIASGMASVVEKPIKPERLRAAMNAAMVAHAAEPRAEGPAPSVRRVA